MEKKMGGQQKGKRKKHEGKALEEPVELTRFPRKGGNDGYLIFSVQRRGLKSGKKKGKLRTLHQWEGKITRKGGQSLARRSIGGFL